MLGDSVIIANTTITTAADGTALLSIHPDGGPAIQQKASSEEVARKHIIPWCDYVRAVMEQREQEKQEEQLTKKARRKEGIVEEPVAKVLPSAAPSNPVDWARDQRDMWQERTLKVEAEIIDLQNTRKEARLNLENWEKILEGLRHESDD